MQVDIRFFVHKLVERLANEVIAMNGKGEVGDADTGIKYVCTYDTTSIHLHYSKNTKSPPHS